MDQPSAKDRFRQALEQAGLYVAVEESDNVITLSGKVESNEARQAVVDIISAIAPGKPIDDGLEVEEIVPTTSPRFTVDDLPAGDLPESLDDLRTRDLEIEPDFTDQELETSTVDMAGEGGATIDPMPEGETVFFPPTDPVVAPAAGGNLEVLGGFSPTSDETLEVAPSVLDDQPGDEALADAVRRELREDAMTTDLVIDVSVRRGVVRLRGTVPSLEEASYAEGVASRLPGVQEVVEELEIAGY
jgi:hypothetical protein